MSGWLIVAGAWALGAYLVLRTMRRAARNRRAEEAVAQRETARRHGGRGGGVR